MSASQKQPALRLRLTAAAENIVRYGHPWVFAGSVQRQNRDGKTGELAVIYDRDNKFLAAGLFDAGSPIRVRIVHVGKPIPIDEKWWLEQWNAARSRREGLFDDATTGYRCINGESEGWPGLILDRYDTTFVLKLYTAAWLPRLRALVELFRRDASRLVLRLSRNISETARVEFGLEDGQVLHGPPVDGPVVFRESGLGFEADVVAGQKTGFFLDQRENRQLVETLARDVSVLNLFSYTGGFSLYAARGGAASVCSLDINPHALAATERNFALNGNVPSIASCARESVQANAFEWLGQPVDRGYDVVVLDPPSLAKRQSEREEALRAYEHLLKGAIARVKPDGMLVAASCSAHVPALEFFDLTRTVARQSGRQFTEWRTTQHAPDHPATFPEASYLKCIYARLGK